eukprot:33677_1
MQRLSDSKEPSPDTTKQKAGLSFLQFLILSSIASGTPYGTEYAVYAMGVEWTIVCIILLSITFSIPAALVSTELMALMPSNHGQIAWSYRAFHNLKYKIFGSPIGDFIGYLNATNTLLYYLLAMPLQPIIFSQYLETALGPVSSGELYLIQFVVVVIAFIINAFNINIVGRFVNWSICIAMIPFFVGFFWRLPDIRISQWTQECSVYDYAFFFSQMAFMAAGYEGLGALGGELNFGATKLMIAFVVSVFISAILMIVPIIASATLAYAECTSWYDGYFAVAYGEIWVPFYYAVLFGGLFSNFAFIVMQFAIASRVIWAMSQPCILLLEDGTMVLPDEMDTLAVNERGNIQNVKTIPLAVLPSKLGFVWDRTGSPIFAVIIFTVWTLISCAFMTVQMVMENIFFMYVFTYICFIVSFLIMKHYEPNTPRWFEVPCGKLGAWILAVISLGIMGFIWIIMTLAMWSGLLICLGWNALLIIYYFTGKKYFDKKRQRDAPVLDKHSDDPDLDAGVNAQETDMLLNRRTT